jgi:pimeloyl-ACP methyl ester carboxylesterase
MRLIVFLFSVTFAFGQNHKAFYYSSTANQLPPVDYAQEGEDYLTANARTFHDFTTLSGAHGSTITSSNDLSPNNRDLTNNPGGLYSANTPTVFKFRFPDITQVPTHYTASNQPLLFTNNTTNAIFSTSHEVHLSFSARSKNFVLYLFGVNSTQVHYAQINTDGKISIFIKRAATTTHLRTVNAVFTQSIQNGDLGNLIALRFRYNFTAGSEECKVYLNNSEIATELVSGSAVASWDSGYSWNNLYSVAIGAYAQATNTTGNTKPHFNHKFAVTPLLSQDDANLVTHCMLSTPPQSGNTVVIGDFRMALTTESKGYAASVYLAESGTETIAVSGSGGVNITGTSLSFTPSDYNVPQLVKIVGNDNYGYIPRTISFGTKDKTVVTAQSFSGTGGKDGTDVYLTDGWNAARLEAHRINIPNISSLRDSIKTTLFKGSYPAGTYETVTTPTSYGGVTLAHASAGAKNRYKFSEDDGNADEYRNYVAHVRNNTPNNKLFIQLFGHGESFHQEMYNSIIALGYDWAGACMAFAVENEEDSPLITASPSWLGHDQLFTSGIDNSSFDARRLFFFDKIRFLDYILTQHSYDEIIVAGVSGGGFETLMWASFDNRIDKAFCVRGANSYNHPESGSDFEQGPSFLTENFGGASASEAVHGPRVTADYRSLGYLKRMALVAANGAEFHHMSHELDVLGGSYYNQIPNDIMQTRCSGFTGSFHVYVNTNASEATHGFNTSDRQYILDNL